MGTVYLATGPGCSPKGEIVLWPTGPDTMLLDYRPEEGRYTARAKMTRV